MAKKRPPRERDGDREKGRRPEPAAVILDPAAAAREFRLPEVDAAVIVGSGVRVGRDWLDAYRARTVLDFTLSDCSLLTGVPVKSLHNWRQAGELKVRALSKSSTDKLLVTPAELVRVLRKIAAERNGVVVVHETPAQVARRGEELRRAAIASCRGET